MAEVIAPQHARSRRLAGALLGAVLAWPLGGFAATAPEAPPPPTATPPMHCVSERSLDLERVLPPPPADGSAHEHAELATLLRIQAQRTGAQVARARADAEVSVFRFADALGNPPHFRAQELPLTSALFHRVESEEETVVGPGKERFGRKRPFRIEPRLKPVLPLTESASYPSGHATWGYAAGLVLADMVPERRAAILGRAGEYAHNRIVAGMHYPSDVDGGQLAGTALAAFLFACPSFEAQEAAAKAELRHALGLP